MRAEDSGKKGVDRLLLVALECVDVIEYIAYFDVHEYGSYERKFLVVCLSVPVLGISKLNALDKVDYIAEPYGFKRSTDNVEFLACAVRRHDICDVSRYRYIVDRPCEEFFVEILPCGLVLDIV